MRPSDRLMCEELKLGPGRPRRSRKHVVGWDGKGGLLEWEGRWEGVDSGMRSGQGHGNGNGRERDETRKWEWRHMWAATSVQVRVKSQSQRWKEALAAKCEKERQREAKAERRGRGTRAQNEGPWTWGRGLKAQMHGLPSSSTTDPRVFFPGISTTTKSASPS